MKKLFFIEDTKNQKSKEAAFELKKIYAGMTARRLQDADTAIVLGGDGFLLRTLPHLLKVNIPVFGLNLGHVGAMMNPYTSEIKQNLPKYIEQAKTIKLRPLETECIDWNGKSKSFYAFNEVCLKTQKPQMAHLGLIKTSHPRNKKDTLPNIVTAHDIYGDGVMVATPIGSTAYYMQAGGKPFSINSKKVGIRSICASQKRCLNQLVPDTTNISISVDDFIRRPVMMTADSKMVRNIVQCRIKLSEHKAITLLLNKEKVRS